MPAPAARSSDGPSACRRRSRRLRAVGCPVVATSAALIEALRELEISRWRSRRRTWTRSTVSNAHSWRKRLRRRIRARTWDFRGRRFGKSRRSGCSSWRARPNCGGGSSIRELHRSSRARSGAGARGARCGKPVLTSNQVTLWALLRALEPERRRSPASDARCGREQSQFLAGTRVRLYEAEISVSIVRRVRSSIRRPSSTSRSTSIRSGRLNRRWPRRRRRSTNPTSTRDTSSLAIAKRSARHHSVDPEDPVLGRADLTIHQAPAPRVERGGRPRARSSADFSRAMNSRRGCTVPRSSVESIRHGPSISEHVYCAREPPVALAFLCTPNNPTGADRALHQVRELARAFPDKFFIVDEALCNLLTWLQCRWCKPNRMSLSCERFRSLSVSPDCASGTHSDPRVCCRSRSWADRRSNVGTAGEAAAVAALDDHGFLDSCHATFHVEAAAFIDALEKQPGYRLRGRYANMLLIELTRRSAPDCIDALAAKGVLVADAACFGGLDGHAMIAFPP